jgi:transposase
MPSEHSSGGSVRRGGITKAGNVLARRVPIEDAWTYRMPARVSRKLYDRSEALPPVVRDITRRAQLRLCAQYRRLAVAGRAATASGTSTGSSTFTQTGCLFAGLQTLININLPVT